MEKQWESGREVWFHGQFTASMSSFCSFVLLLLSVREWGKVKMQLCGEKCPRAGTALLPPSLFSVLLYRKNVNAASPLQAGISFPALNANAPRFPFTSRKRHHSILCFFFFSIGARLLFSVLVKIRSLLLISNLSSFQKLVFSKRTKRTEEGGGPQHQNMKKQCWWCRKLPGKLLPIL